MNPPSNDSDTDKFSALKLSINLPLTNFEALSNLIYTDFYGQEQGENSKFDALCKRHEKARDELGDSSAQQLQLAVLEGRVDELKMADGHCGFDEGNSVHINNRITALNKQIEGLK